MLSEFSMFGAELEPRYAVSRSSGFVDSADLNRLMARLADGDRSAFPSVFRELWPRLRALCGSLLKHREDAEDAAQRAMEKILTRAADYDPERPALAWALSIAAWECRTLARWRQRRAEISSEHVEGVERAPGAGSAPDAEEELLRAELERAALSALTELSEADRGALVAAFWQEAKAGGATARKRRQRAIERLRLAFRRLYGAD
jgi:RNA polymerase sigma-70 factor (ECF subfamily)